MRIIICSAGWLEDRKRTLGRLIEQLGDVPVTVLASKRPEHAAIWARRAWERAEEIDDDTTILNDDVIVPPDFLKIVTAMAEAAPGRSLSLHTGLPEASRVRGRWLRSYWYSGPAVMIPKGRATEMLDFWAKLPWSFNARPGANEDVIAIHHAWSKQEPFWHAVPSVVKHDTETKSSLGYDGHKLRTSPVGWERFPDARLTDVDYWREGSASPQFIENPWCKTDYLAAVHKGLKLPNVCDGCFQQAGLVRAGGPFLCAPCIGRMAYPVLMNAVAT